MLCSIREDIIIFKSLYALYLAQIVYGFGNFFSHIFKLTGFFGCIGGIVATNDPIKGILPFCYMCFTFFLSIAVFLISSISFDPFLEFLSLGLYYNMV